MGLFRELRTKLGLRKRKVDALGTRASFLPLIDSSMPTLEIGPFYSPVVKGASVSYFDVIDREAMVARAKALELGDVDPPHIHYVSPYGDLTIIDRTFSNVVSSHCIEHQPDLVTHLQNVGGLLADGGRYYVLAPDKRYCFDHFLPESLLSEVICSYVQRRQNHTFEHFIRHQAHTTHNNSVRHWNGDHSDPADAEGNHARALQTAKSFHTLEGYLDVHAWQFTPDSFAAICHDLYNLGLSPFVVTKILPTQRNDLEFAAILEKLDSAQLDT